MSKPQNLDHDEKVFLAGCIKMIMLADGTIEELELNDLEKIQSRLQFDDFEDCLGEFENTVKDSESYFLLAEKIENTEAQDLILEILDELILQSGSPDPTQKSIFDRLQEIWT